VAEHDCLPHWHDRLVAFATDTRKVTRCPVGSDDFVPCPPEQLRAAAERIMRDSDGWSRFKKLPLDTYSLARNIRSEHDSGTVEAKVAIAEAVYNEARRRGTSVTRLLLINSGSKPLYGRQRQGRFAGTSRDPTVGDVLIADFVLRGKSDDFARGATKFLHPKGMGGRLIDVVKDRFKSHVWTGHLPGVQTTDQIMFIPAPIGPSEKAKNAEALRVLRDRVQVAQPLFPCDPPPNQLLRLTGIGLASAAAVAAVAFFLTSEVEPARRVRDWIPRTFDPNASED
jgi:hypothetical protein